MKLTFLGAAGTVTGSKYLVQAGNKQILIDCGLFQGLKNLRLRNWAKLPVDPSTVDAVILTHAHIDHTGYVPLFVKNGFKGNIYCSRATHELCEVMLLDSAHLQEEEARYANKRGFSKHRPALPLYTQDDARAALRQFVPIDFDSTTDLGGDVHAKLSPSGHILGSAFVRLEYSGTSILFSGDIGRPNDIIMRPPVAIKEADYLVLESTYGDRLHSKEDPKAKLGEVISRTLARNGIVLIPVFAVGRAQEILYYIHLLKAEGTIPDIPVYLNSPMARDATQIFHKHQGEHRLDVKQCEAACKTAHIVNSIEESIALNQASGPMIVLSASGMATGGRVVHHMKAFAPDARNTILFVGFQAAGTRGAALLDGAENIKIHGEYVPVRSEIAYVSNLSAHADYQEILTWLKNFDIPPKTTFITHGEPSAADALRRHIEETFHWETIVPEYLESRVLNP
jgi:metallo-beta-lactamase family protein